LAIWTITKLTLREASRRKLLLAVAALTLIVAVLSGWAFHRLIQIPCGTPGNRYPCPPAETKLLAATLLILLMFMFSFVLALGAAFLGAPSIAGDVESGLILAILPRPIRRIDVVLGKWLGLSILLALYAAIAIGMELVIIRFAMNYQPPHPILAVVFVVLEAITVLTLTLAASTRVPAMTCGIVVLILFGVTWIAGIAGSVGAALHSTTIQSIGTVSSLILPTDGLWRAAVYNLQPAAVSLLQASAGGRGSNDPFFVYSAPSGTYLLWAFAWLLGLLAIAAWSFQRREL